MLSLLINVTKPSVKKVHIKDFRDFLKYLDCRCFTVVTTRLGDEQRKFDFYIDDEGLLKDTPIVSAVNMDMYPCLYGNIVIGKHDKRGQQIPLTEDDIDYINEYIVVGTLLKTGALYPVLVDIDY